MFTSGNTSPCHHSLHLFVKTDESQQAGIVQKLSDQALNLWEKKENIEFEETPYKFEINPRRKDWKRRTFERRMNSLFVPGATSLPEERV
ncbi:hypothetical protein CFR80_17490 [Komagataeibacter oboediens]|uniref:Uncharacterized protein n=1 Tax=Komagataeibacter oboediens TaxID=65958 RepID=A0A318QDJ0_9PROT|nr:hypothetical protein CFR80_17490 [Komagataeibacter oboediens]